MNKFLGNKPRIIVLLVYLLFLNAYDASSQVSHHSNIFIQKEHFYFLQKFDDTEGKIQGKMFDNPLFTDGSLLILGKRYEVPMRYNIYLEAFEVRYEQKNFYVQGDQIDTVFYDQSPYIFLKQDGKYKVYEVLSEKGKQLLLKKHQIEYVPGSSGKPFKNDVSPQLKQRSPIFYFYIDNELFDLSSFKPLYEKYPKRKDELKSFIKTNKIKRNRISSLTRLLDFTSTF